MVLTLNPTPRESSDPRDLYRYLDPVIQSWLGVSGKGVAFRATQVNDPTNYAVDVENLDVAGSPTRKGLRVVAGAHSVIVNGSGITLSSLSTTGNLTVGGTLQVTGTSTLGVVNAGATAVTTLAVSSTLNVTGTSTLGVVNAGATGVTTLAVSSTLGVTGTSTLGVVNAGATTVTALTTNSTVTLNSNVTIAGTLGVSSATSLSTLAVSSILNVTGTSTLGTVNAGAVSGTTGTFSGAVSGTTGTFSGAVSGTTGTFSAAVSGTTITGSSTVQGTRLISTVATGTAPLTVSSTTNVANLNAEYLNDKHDTAFAQLAAASNFTTAPTINGSTIALVGANVSFATLTVTGNIAHTGSGGAIGFYNVTPVSRQTVTGSRGGNAALLDVITKLENLGLIINSTSA